jgi:hypothetical protein
VTLPVISVIVPTVEGREENLEMCVAAYTKLAEGAYELDLIIEHDHPSCGAGWQAGLAHAKGEYIHLSDDDIVPQPGWHIPAIEAVECGFLPAPQVTDPRGYPQSRPQEGAFGKDWTPVDMSALPFASAEQMEKITPLLTCHYYTDDWIGWRGARAGWQTVLRSEYRFVHWWAQHKRGAGMTQEERMVHDRGFFEEAMRRARAGEWNEPWPPNGGRPE